MVRAFPSRCRVGASRPLAMLLTGALLLAGGLGALPAHAVDLPQAYELARQHDARLRAARAAADAQRERLPQAQAQRLPQVTFSASRLHNDLTRTSANFLGQPVTVDERYWSENLTLSVRQPLYRPALVAGIEVARAQVADAEAVLRVEEGNLAARVAEAYFNVLLAQDQLELVLVQRRAAEAQADAARKALVAGTGTRTDVDDLEARLDLLRADELRARQQIDFARRQLEVLTGALPSAPRPLDHDRLSLPELVPADLQAWLQRAEAASPELAALRARRDAAAAEVERAAAGHRPTVDAVLQLTRSASENVTTPSSRYTNRAVGVQLNVPLYSGGYIDSTVRQAMAELTRAEENLESLRRDLHVRVAEQHRLVVEGAQRIQALQRAVASARTALHSAERSRLAGLRTILDILDAEDRLQRAQRELRFARYQYLLARVRLQVLCGDDGVAELSRLTFSEGRQTS